MDRESRFRDAIAKHKDSIYRICCSYVYDEDERKDVYQEVLVHLWKGLDAFEERSQLSTWIYRITVNTCLGHLRSEKRRKRVLVDSKTVSAGECADEVDRSVWSDDDVRNLYACINRLEPVERALVALYLEDVSTREVADILGISEGNVRVRFHRIRKDLRDIWEREGYGSE